jgi:hypothetical protein
MEAQALLQTIIGPNLFCYPEDGFDFVDHDIGSQLESSASQCCFHCNARPGCNAYSWSNFNGGTCWFKSQRGAVVFKAGVKSALIFHTPQQTCTITLNFDYVDNDIGNAPSLSAEGCCNICRGWSGCRAFSWSNHNGGTCWLKSSKGETRPSSGVKSAEVYPSPIVVPPVCPNLQDNVDFLDHDIGNAPSPTAAGCCALCKARSGCRAFSWSNHNGGTCWLKSRTGATKPTQGVTSATVFPNLPPTCNVKDGIDYVDHDIGNAPSPLAEGCCDICRGWSGCRAFSWSNHNGGTCWLKSMKGADQPTAGVRSAVVV